MSPYGGYSPTPSISTLAAKRMWVWPMGHTRVLRSYRTEQNRIVRNFYLNVAISTCQWPSRGSSCSCWRVEMSTDRSREALGRFLDFLGEKGLMAPATAQTRKTSALKLLGVLDKEEAVDVTNIDVDQIARRFTNLHGQSYNPESVLAYRSRLKSALADFRAYLDNPLSFKPALQGRERTSRNRKEAGETPKTERIDPPAEPQRSQSSPVMASSNVMPIPIRADLTILIHGLPHDLTEIEARKISGVITALAVST